MGAASSSPPIHAFVTSSSDECKNYLRGAISRGNVLTGCESKSWSFTVGGADGGAVGIDDLVRDYDQSASAKGKRDLIRKLAEGVSKVMGTKPPPAGASPDIMVAHLQRIVPDPRRGRSIIDDPQRQIKICGDLAKVVNEAYGKVIDTSLGPNGICSQVNDIIQSLGAGLHKELIVVAASVERAIQNITDLKDMMRRSFDKLHSEIAASDDEKLRYKVEGLRNINAAIETELERQLGILSNLTSTSLKTADRDLVRLLADNTDFVGLVDKIKKNVGSTDWGNKLGYWLSGVNNVAQMALIVDRALKTIGMKAADYKKSTKMSDLAMKTHELMVAGANSKLATRTAMNDFVNAVEQLRKYHGFHDEIAREIKGAAEDAYGGMYGAEAGDLMREGGGGRGRRRGAFGGDAMLSGEAGGVIGGRIPLQKKIKAHEKVRSHMLVDFRTKAKVLMDRVYASVFAAAQKMGRGGIELTDDVYLLKTALNDLTAVFRDGIEYALTGYYTHITAVEQKDRFLQSLRSMSQILDALKGVAEFREMSNNIGELIKLVDFYTDRFKAHTGNTAQTRTTGAYGGDEMDVVGACDYGGKRGGGDDSSSDDDFGVTAEGACDFIGAGEADMMPEVVGAGEFKAVVTLNNARNTFNHFYNIAKFKQNLKQAAAEMKGYNKNYVDHMGVAVAAEIDIIVAWKDDMLKLNGGAGAAYPEYSTDMAAIVAGDAKMKGEQGVVPADYSAENVAAIVNAIADAKIKLYKVAQAIDVYLQNFTDAVATAPEDVRQVAKLLDSVEIMANWFNEKSGDSIAAMYEIFPWTMIGFRTYFNKGLEGSMLSLDATATRLSSGKHYYQAIAATIDGVPPPSEHLPADFADDAKAKLPGNPFLPISPRRAVLAHKFAKYTVDKMFALKNIVSAFAYLGDKFAGKSVLQTTFMSPSDMYKHLVDYVYVSALSIGWGRSEQLVIYGRKPGAGPGTYTAGPGLEFAAKKVIAGRHLASNLRSGSDAAGIIAECGIDDNANTTRSWLPGIAAAGVGRSNVLNADYDVGGLVREVGLFRFSPAATHGQVVGEDTYVMTAGILQGPITDRVVSMNRPAENRVKRSEFDAAAAARVFAPVAGMRQNFGVVMSGIGWEVGAKDSVSGWIAQFAKEDRIFIDVVKAMAAKVFTVTGLYNMLNFADTRNYALSPMRMILGGGRRSGGSGGSFELPKIYPEAVELYARLPLLVEFYRDIFCFEEKCDDPSAEDGDEELLISMVPEVGSVYAALIQLIFDQPINTQGLYTDSVQRRVIHEINEIYHVFKAKNPKNYTMAAITDFVAEINSRYGLMSRNEITSYRKEEQTRRSENKYGEGADIESYDILDEDTQSTGVAPSDRFGKSGATYIPGRSPDEHKIDVAAYSALNKLRKRIDNRFRDVMLTAPDGTGMPVESKNVPDFGALILSVRASLQTTDKPEERFKMVSNMMVGMDTKTQTKREAYLMFHEYIIAPLNVLAAVHDMLARYEREVREWDAYSLFKGLEKTYDAWADGKHGAAPGYGWRVWAQQRMTGGAVVAWTTAMDTAVGAGAGITDDAANDTGLGAANWIARNDSDMRKEMRKHIGLEEKSSEIETAIIRNLHRRHTHRYKMKGLDGVTFLELLRGIDLTIPRNVSPLDITHTGGVRNGDAGAGAARATHIKSHLSPVNGTDRDYGPHRIVAYAAIRWEALFKKLTNLVYGLTSGLNGLVETNFANGLITINHTKLQSMCEEVLGTVRRDMDKFRNVIDSGTLEKYDSRSICGSLNWLQENMIDGLFGDREKRGLKRAHIIVTKSFQLLANQDPDKRNQRILYREYSIRAGVPLEEPTWTVSVQSGPHPERKIDRTHGWPVEDAFAELTHYNSRTMTSRAAIGSDPLDNTDATLHFTADHRQSETTENFASPGSLEHVWTFNEPYAHLFKDPTEDGKKRDYKEIDFKARFDFYLQNGTDSTHKNKGFRGDYCGEGKPRTRYDEDGKVLPRDMVGAKTDQGAGLMIKFNEVLAAYLRQFWDISTSKIYAPLIDKPANGVMNQAVFKALGWPDFSPPVLSATLGAAINDVWEEEVRSEVGGNVDRLNASNDGKLPVGADAGAVAAQNMNKYVLTAWANIFSADIKSAAPQMVAPVNHDDPGAINRGSLFVAVSKMWSLLYPGAQDQFLDAVPAGPNLALTVRAAGLNTAGTRPAQDRAAKYMNAALRFNKHIHTMLPYGTDEAGSTIRDLYWLGRVFRDSKLVEKYVLTAPAGWEVNINATWIQTRPGGALAEFKDVSGVNADANADNIRPAAGSPARVAAAIGFRGPDNDRLAGGAWPVVGLYNAGFGMRVNYGADKLAHPAAGTYTIPNGTPMPGTCMMNAGMFCVSMRNLHRLKRAIVHSARMAKYMDIDSMRRWVMQYIRGPMADRIHREELNRCTAAVRLQRGPYQLGKGRIDDETRLIAAMGAGGAARVAIDAAADPGGAGGHNPTATTEAATAALDGTQAARDAFRAYLVAVVRPWNANAAAAGQAFDNQVALFSTRYDPDLNRSLMSEEHTSQYAAQINEQARRVEAFVVNLILVPYAYEIFNTVAEEGKNVTIIDVVALATVLIEPVSREIAISYQVWASELGHTYSGKPTTLGAPIGSDTVDESKAIANHLARVRIYYESGGTLPVERGIAMFDFIDNKAGTGGTEFAAFGGANAQFTAAIDAITNESKAIHDGSHETEGWVNIGDDIYGAAIAPGDGTGAAHGRYRPGVRVAIAHHASLEFGRDLNPLPAVIMSKLLGLGMSSDTPNISAAALPAAPGVADTAQASAAIRLGSTKILTAGSNINAHANGIEINADGVRASARPARMSGVDVVDLRQLTGFVMAWDANHHGGPGAVDQRGSLMSDGYATIASGGLLRQDILTTAAGVLNSLGISLEYASRHLTSRSLGDKKAMLKESSHSAFETMAIIEPLGDPEEIIFASLAKVMRTALVETGRGGTKPNLVQSMAEVPSRMKEQYKSQLPIFHDMFSLIGKKAELLKGVSRLNIGLDRMQPSDDVTARMPEPGIHGGTLRHRPLNQVEAHVFYTKLLDKITASCDSMKKTCDEVLNELNDAPLYLETAEGSIQAHKSSSGGYPFMPLSTALVTLSPPLRHNAAADSGAVKRRECELGYPSDGPGADVDTFNYATRLLLHRYDTNIMLEHMPGVQDLIAKYNRAAIPAKRIDEKSYGIFVNKTVGLLRYAAATKIYSTLFGAERGVVDRNLFRVGANSCVITNPVFQATIALSDALSLTSSSDQESSLSRTVGFVAGDGHGAVSKSPRSRRDAMTYNILDINVSPINVHAMRREIPLVNVINFAATFDSFVTDFAHSTADKCADLKANATTHEILAALCKDPHGLIAKDVYYGKLRSLVSGASSLGAYGYPKFIADQLWNKALLNQIDDSADEGKMYSDTIPRHGGDVAALITSWIEPDGAPAPGRTEYKLQFRDPSVSNGTHSAKTAAVVPAGARQPLNAHDAIQGEGHSQKQYLGELGRLRFDTTFARNMFFIANVQRLMLNSIKKELTRVPYPVVSDAGVADRGLTEYTDHEVHADLQID